MKGRLKIILLFFCLGCVISMQAQVVVRRALIFGLGKQADRSWASIHGDKDVRLIVQMLTKANFTDIRTLVNEQATKAQMEVAFQELIKRCHEGDIVYVHYSGHGQLMTDVDGDEAERWTGKHRFWDESWIPYDAYMHYCDKDKGEKHFCDDEVAKYMHRLREKVGQRGKLFVVVDACHSGDSTRGANDKECVRGVDEEFIMPVKPNAVCSNLVPETWLTVSACRPYQLCFEHYEPQVGKLSYAICKLGAKMFRMSNSDLQAWLDNYMEAHPSRLSQNPVVSGKR